MKSRKDNDVTNCKGVIFVEYDAELLIPIGHYMVYDKDQVGQ